jgi:hypothetical protein
MPKRCGRNGSIRAGGARSRLVPGPDRESRRLQTMGARENWKSEFSQKLQFGALIFEEFLFSPRCGRN